MLCVTYIYVINEFPVTGPIAKSLSVPTVISYIHIFTSSVSSGLKKEEDHLFLRMET